ncbi:MAG: TonB-dependent receptor [Bacteroidales bacterium]|nr:TonB-dependent receptor [Bacteroidales bacterium]
MNRTFRAVAATLPVLLAVSGITGASAEEKTVDKPGISEQADTLTLDESVVSSVKTGSGTRDIPSEVTVVTSMDAKKLSSPTVADIFRKEPGLSKGGDGIWATNIRIRGLGENRLVTLANGSRVEVASDLTTSLSMFDVNDIDHVEVIRGAQSSIYGSGAMGGIINVIGKDGHFAASPYFNGNLTASYSSVNNGHSEYLALYGGGGRWYVKVNGSFRQGGNVRTPVGIMGNSAYNGADIGVTAAFKPKDNHTLKLQFQRNFSWDVGIPGGAAFTPDAKASYKKAGRTLASINYDIEHLTQNLDALKFKAFYQGIILDVNMNPNMARPQTGALPTLVAPYAEHHSFGVNGEGRWRFGERNRLTAGVEMWRRAISSDRAKYIDQYAAGTLAAQMIRRETPLPRASYTSAGIYAQDEMRFLDDRLIFTLGARADVNVMKNGECHNVESIENVTAGTVIDNPPGKYVTFEAGGRTDPSWSANAGLLFKATGNLDLTLNLSRSYRSPALEELFKFIDLAGNKIHFGNPKLKAEKGLGADLGLRYRSERFRLHVDGFINNINDMIVERKVNVSPDSANDTLMLGNTGRALLYGAELSVSYKLVRGLELYASGAVTVGKETTPARTWLPMIPPASLNAGISYRNDRILGADLGVTAAAARPSGKTADGERATEGWWRMDFAIHSRIFNFGRCNLQLFAGVDNILNAAYVNFLATNRGNIICEPGRNFYFRVNFTF